MEIVSGEQEINQEIWKEFVKTHPQGNIFQTPGMFKVFQSDPKYSVGIVTCFDGENMLGVLVWVIQREFTNLLGALTSRAIVFGGPLVENDDPIIVKELLLSFLAQVKRRAIYTEFRNLHDLSWAWLEFEKQKFIREAHVNFLIDITQNDDELLASMSQSRRKMLKRVLRNERLEVRQITETEDLKEFYRLIEITYRKVGKPFPGFAHFLNSLRFMDDKAACFLCYAGKTPVASRFVFCYKNGIYDWYAGSDPDYNHLNSNEYIVWEILQWGRAKGYKMFDFGGGGNPNKPYGPREFKRRFGGKEVSYQRFSIVHKPLLMKFGKLGLKIKQKLRI